MVPDYTTLTSIARQYQADGQRYGQSLFNALHLLNPSLANSLIGTDADPFFADSPKHQRITNFFARLYMQ